MACAHMANGQMGSTMEYRYIAAQHGFKSPKYLSYTQQRRLRGNLIETCKFLIGKKKIKSDQLFQKATTTELRGHSLKLYKKSSRLELR